MDRKEKELLLWQDWKTTGSNRSRNDLLRSIDPLLQKQVNKFQTSPLPRTALETEARMLALKAFETYDPSKAQLNTHVTNHLKHLQRYVIEYQNVGKIPESRALEISKFNNISSHLEDSLGREPSTAELADELGWSTAEVDRMLTELRSDLDIRQVEPDAEGTGFYDYTAFQSKGIDDALEFVYFDASMEDKLILEYTFGIKGKKRMSVADIAKKLNKTESYVRTRLKKLALRIKLSM